MFKEFDEIPRLQTLEYFAVEYPYLAEAYLHWGIDPQSACIDGIAATPSRFREAMGVILYKFFYSENSLLEDCAYTHRLPLPVGVSYHRHGLQTFRLAAWALGYLIRSRKIEPSESEQCGFLVGSLLHDFLRTFVRVTSEDKTSQVSTDDSLLALLSQVPIAAPLREEWCRITERVIYYKNQTHYDECGRWLAFRGPHEVHFSPPPEGLTPQNVLDVLVPWCDIASQVTLPGYRLLRYYDLNFPWGLDIPEGFKRLLRALEHNDWQLSNILPEPYRENFLTLIGLGLPASATTPTESTTSAAAES